jgi:hypothetical protein
MAGSVIGDSSKGKDKETPKTTALVGEIDKNIRYKTIEPFTGERNKLQGFLLQLRLYVKFNGERFRSETEQVLWAVTLLEGKAMNWIEGFLEDYLNLTNTKGEINHSKMEDTTIKIFATWKGFVDEIKANFGVTDERKEAERAIESLKQRGSATAYTRDFQRYSTKTEWGDEALRYQYRKGLKDFVKDELLRTGQKTDTLENLIAAACEIDNAWYERSMEKKGKYDPDYKRMGEGRHRFQRGNRHDRGDPMELDAAFQGKISSQEKQDRMQKKLCFNCGKPGHMARNCRSGGDSLRGPRNKGRRGQLNATFRGRGGYDTTEPDQEEKTHWDNVMRLNVASGGFALGTYPVPEGESGSRIPPNVVDKLVRKWTKQDDDKESRGDDTPVQLWNRTASPSPEASEPEYENVDQSPEAATFVENLGEDPEDDSNSEYSSAPSEITESEYRTTQILAGVELANTYYGESRSRTHKQAEELDKQYGDTSDDLRVHMNYLSKKIKIIVEYKSELAILDVAIDKQIREMEQAHQMDFIRSQQFQDKLAANIDFQKNHLTPERAKQAKLYLALRNELEDLRENENVAKIDHPRHEELAWSFCYTDSCTIHHSSKQGSGYWPKKRTPVYWAERTVSRTAEKKVQQSKN